jgi:hypothetical protein
VVSVALDDGAVPPEVSPGLRAALVPGTAPGTAGQGIGGAPRAQAAVIGIVTAVREAVARPGALVVTLLVDTAAVRTVADMANPILVLLPQQGVESP